MTLAVWYLHWPWHGQNIEYHMAHGGHWWGCYLGIFPFLSSPCNPFEDQVPTDKIDGYLLFKWDCIYGTWPSYFYHGKPIHKKESFYIETGLQMSQCCHQQLQCWLQIKHGSVETSSVTNHKVWQYFAQKNTIFLTQFVPTTTSKKILKSQHQFFTILDYT